MIDGNISDQDDRWALITEDTLPEVSLPLGVLPSGLVTQVTVRGEQGSGQTHQWFVLLDPALYEPVTLERIRRTGSDLP